MIGPVDTLNVPCKRLTKNMHTKYSHMHTRALTAHAHKVETNACLFSFYHNVSVPKTPFVRECGMCMCVPVCICA